MPLFALLWIPIGTIGFKLLYPWTHQSDVVLERKRWFLSNGPFFTRAAIYFLVWSIFSYAVWSMSVKRDSATPEQATWVTGEAETRFGTAPRMLLEL